MTPSTVLISGAGQIGSRYLQGLAQCRSPLRIFVQDVDSVSLERASQRWLEVGVAPSFHQVSFSTELDFLPAHLDIAVVATTAKVRPKVVQEIAKKTKVEAWVLEKVLAQSNSGLDSIIKSVGHCAKAWVNTPRRMLPWHQCIKEKLGNHKPISLRVDGCSWGMCCNSIHFLDMFSWFTGETLVEINTLHLDSLWFKAKRPDNWEVFGTLRAEFSGGSTADFSVADGDLRYVFKINDGVHTWVMDEFAGSAMRSDGLNYPGRLPLQSEMTSGLVETILETGHCALPTLTESVELHRVLIRSLLDHWRQTMEPGAPSVPIT